MISTRKIKTPLRETGSYQVSRMNFGETSVACRALTFVFHGCRRTCGRTFAAPYCRNVDSELLLPLCAAIVLVCVRITLERCEDPLRFHSSVTEVAVVISYQDEFSSGCVNT